MVDVGSSWAMNQPTENAIEENWSEFICCIHTNEHSIECSVRIYVRSSEKKPLTREIKTKFAHLFSLYWMWFVAHKFHCAPWNRWVICVSLFRALIRQMDINVVLPAAFVREKRDELKCFCAFTIHPFRWWAFGVRAHCVGGGGNTKQVIKTLN